MSRSSTSRSLAKQLLDYCDALKELRRLGKVKGHVNPLFSKTSPDS